MTSTQYGWPSRDDSKIKRNPCSHFKRSRVLILPDRRCIAPYIYIYMWWSWLLWSLSARQKRSDCQQDEGLSIVLWFRSVMNKMISVIVDIMSHHSTAFLPVHPALHPPSSSSSHRLLLLLQQRILHRSASPCSLSHRKSSPLHAGTSSFARILAQKINKNSNSSSPLFIY